MRGLLNALYVLRFDRVPPLLMRDTVQAMQCYILEDIVSKLSEVIEIKSQGLERETILRISLFDEFFEQKLAEIYPNLNKRKIDRKFFDNYLQKILGIKQ